MNHNSATVRPGQRIWDGIAYLIPIGGFAIGLFLLLRGIAQPWSGLGDSDGALFSSIAHNYLQFGVFELKFGQLASYEELARPGGIYYLHHPPLFPLLVAASFALFGEAEAYARLVSVLATLATAALLFTMVRKMTNGRTAVLAIFLFMTYPSTILFGRKPGYEALTLLFVVLATWLYQTYRNNSARSTLLLLFAALAAAAASDWAAYLLPPALLGHYLLTRKDARVDWPLLAGLVLTPTAILVSFLLAIYVVDKTSLLSLLHQGLAYAGFVPEDSDIASTVVEAQIAFSPKAYFFRLVQNFDLAFGAIAALLAMLGLVFVRSHRELKHVVLVLSCVVLGTFMIFWRSLFFHLWWLHLLTVPLAILGAVAVAGMLDFAGHEKQAYGQAAKAGIMAAVALPVMLTMLYSVWQLSGEQIRVLPEGRPERPDFIRELGRRIHRSTAIHDQVLTNLVPGREKTNSYIRTLPYYSRRVIVPGITSPGQIRPQLAQKDAQPGGATYFLLEPEAGAGLMEGGLIAWLHSHGSVVPLSIQGHRFELFKLDGAPGAS
ncbi:MAG: glycosyltransferase family 39 protein [Thiobacillus sp.]